MQINNQSKSKSDMVSLHFLIFVMNLLFEHVSMQPITKPITFTYTKLSNREFSSVSIYNVASLQMKNHISCIGKCNELLTQCATVSYNSDTNVCNLYSMPKSDLIDSTNSAIYCRQVVNFATIATFTNTTITTTATATSTTATTTTTKYACK